MYFDLASQEIASCLCLGYPFSRRHFLFGGLTFPLSPDISAPPNVSIDDVPTGGISAPDPHLKLPYTRQWNFALQQALGPSQAISVSYVAAVGRRLLQGEFALAP